MNPEELLARVQADTGVNPVGSRMLGTTLEHANAALALLLHGPKRADARALVDVEDADGPFPEVGQHWLITDGNTQPCALVRIEEVRRGPLYTVDAAFAWEVAEGDRTRASWLTAQELLLHAENVSDVAGEEMVFERFTRVWPEEPPVQWWAPGVREVRGHEVLPDGPRPDLPALALFHDELVVGVLRFEPLPDDLRLVTLQADSPEADTLLPRGLAARRNAGRTH